jgi:hypothetical protein
MREIRLILIITMALLIIAACSPNTQEMNNPLVTPPAEPEEGMATVTGRVISEDSGLPLSDTIIRLAEVVRQEEEAAYVLDVAFSPGADSDGEGFFIFENVDPIEYVIIVGDPYENYKVIVAEDGKAKTWTTVDGQILNVGELIVDLSP